MGDDLRSRFDMQAPPLSDQSENLSRNPTAFRPMYEQHSGWLKANVRRRFGSQDAEDIVQETWLRLASIVSLAEIRHPRAFLLRIATNLASTRHRRRDLALRAEAVAAAARGGIDADQADTAMFVQIILSLPQPLRDRIVVGEMRDGAAALETLKSWNTGHPGGLSTVHANSAADVLRRVEDLIAEVSARTPRRAIAQAVDRIVHIRRTETGRCVEAILSIEPDDVGEYTINSIG